jgi:hypothetical protein
MSFEIGDTFSANDQYNHIDDHLWVIISYPIDSPGKIVIVNVTSWKNNAAGINDESCVINAGEHPRILHKSFVFYRKAKFTTLSELASALNCNAIIKDESCSDALLDKILDGASNSRYTPLDIIQLLDTQALL